MIIGLIGLALLVVGWIPETIQVIRDKKTYLNIKFAVLYTTGSLLLTIHAYIIKDFVFVLLNTLVFIMSGISLFFTLRKRN